MQKIFKEMDEGEENQDMLSDVEIKEYWDNIKRTAQAENKIISQIISTNNEEDKQKGSYNENVMELLKREKEGEGDDEEIEEFEVELHSPK
mmetsp:Transcript_32379/g.31775  ORF Transcript_32379/g.31775 Transcript_32379/m.31775 type:complete len:91 (-) Transcript_32379:478-750(-)